MQQEQEKPRSKRTRNIILIIAGVLVIVVAILGYLVYDRLSEDPIELGRANGDLAFMSDRDGNWDIFIMDTEGNMLNITTASDGHEFGFNFTFEGEVLNLYTSHSGEVTPGTVNADGTEFQDLSWVSAFSTAFTRDLLDYDPAWSPDGTEIAFSSIRSLMGSNLYLAPIDSSDPEKLTDGGQSNNMQAWSPDGTRLVFASDHEDSGGDQHIYVLDVESGDVTKLSTDAGYDIQPVWSLDGEKVLFISEQETPLTSGQFDFYVVNADGSDLHPLGIDEVFEGDPTYSPDGTEIVYMSNEDGFWHLYVMDAEGDNVRRLTEGESNNLFPAWRPIPAEELETEAE